MSGYTQGILILVGINLIAVLGIAILTGFTRLFSFGNAGFMSIGAYASAILTVRCGVPFLVSLPLAAALAGVAGFLLGTVTLRLKGDYFLITTLGFGECVRVLFDYITPVTGGAQGFSGIPRYTTVTVVLLSVALAFAFAWTLVHSRYGRDLEAIREQEIAAEAVGIHVFRARRLSFTVSAIFAGWAGSLYAHNLTFLEPKAFDLQKSAEMTITAVIGGLGSLTGAMLGTGIVTLLPELFRGLASWRMLMYGAAVVVIIILRPGGLCGYREFSLTGCIRWISSRVNRASSKEVK